MKTKKKYKKRKDLEMEITAFDCVPMMIKEDAFSNLEKGHPTNLPHILGLTLNTTIYEAKNGYIDSHGMEHPYMYYILAKRKNIPELKRAGFIYADIGACEEILSQYYDELDKLLKKRNKKMKRFMKRSK